MASAWLGSLPRIGGPPIPEETLFRVLQSRRRRYALHHLQRRQDRVPVCQVAERIAAWENDIPVPSVSTDERRRVCVSLLETHFPLMEDVDMIVLDEDTYEVALTEAAEHIDIYAEPEPEREIQWSERYLGLAAIGGVVIAGMELGVYPLTKLPPVACLGFVCLLFGVSAVLHALAHRENSYGTDGRPPE